MSVIEMHSSWLTINSIVGCPNGCKYCLLQATNDNNCFLKQLATPEELVKQLLEYQYYDKDIPVCLLPNTDAFVNPKNIRYLLDLLDELEKNNVPNDLIIITKCKITDEVISKVKEIKSKGQNVVSILNDKVGKGLGKMMKGSDLQQSSNPFARAYGRMLESRGKGNVKDAASKWDFTNDKYNVDYVRGGVSLAREGIDNIKSGFGGAFNGIRNIGNPHSSRYHSRPRISDYESESDRL